MKYIEAPDMPFDRIQGLHLIKLDNNETKYDVFLEAPAHFHSSSQLYLKNCALF